MLLNEGEVGIKFSTNMIEKLTAEDEKDHQKLGTYKGNFFAVN